MTQLQPEHERYARGYRLLMSGWADWSTIQDMSLDEVDLQVLLLEARDHAEPDGELEGGIL
jgi:hypothetical protein